LGYFSSRARLNWHHLLCLPFVQRKTHRAYRRPYSYRYRRIMLYSLVTVKWIYVLSAFACDCVLCTCITPSLHDQAIIEQTSSKHRANAKQWSMYKA